MECVRKRRAMEDGRRVVLELHSKAIDALKSESRSMSEKENQTKKEACSVDNVDSKNRQV